MMTFNSLRPKIIVSFFFTFLATFLLLMFFLSPSNTLSEHKQWVNSKLQSEKPPPYSAVFMKTDYALTKNKLDLSVWGGRQEILYKHPLPLKRISFDIFLPQAKAPGRSLYFLFNRIDGSQNFAELRVSDDPRHPSAFILLNHLREYIQVRPFPFEGQRNSWNKILLEFFPHKVNLYLDQSLISTFDLSIHTVQEFGFLGDLDPLKVDNVHMDLDHEDPMKLLGAHLSPHLLEAFDGPHWLHAIFSSMLKLSSKDLREQIIREYPDDFLILKQQLDIEAQFRSSDFKYIYFIGGPQLWGMGAMRAEETISEITQKYLSQHPQLSCYKIINASQPWVNLTEVWKNHHPYLALFQPAVTVLSLNHSMSNENYFFEIFNQHFHSLIYQLIKNKHPLLLINDPFEIPSSWQVEKGNIIRKIADELSLPFLDLQNLNQQYQDMGMLWWNDNTLTSYGHSLYAQKFIDRLVPLLKLCGAP